LRQKSVAMEHKQEIDHKEPLLGGELTFATTDEDVSFFHDFIAGGVAGSLSVVVGHPFDTLKVRMQTSGGSLLSLATSYGGAASLFRGMAAPLSAACAINATIFASYGWSSRLYDQYIPTPENSKNPVHDPSIKAFSCGSFAGLVQCVVICPIEHLKCRLQVQHGKGAPDNIYKGPVQAARSIVKNYGISGLFRGWCVTSWREVPAFGLYFAIYDLAKDRINKFLEKEVSGFVANSHTWIASALAGGLTGATTWAAIYPFDIIKTRIQTAPMDTPLSERRIWKIGKDIVRNEGLRSLFRGLNVTVLRAFPVNGIIFPVYEWTLMNVVALEY